ncbi:5613_t:CDS:1, partial [Dentiscutata erythropus]
STTGSTSAPPQTYSEVSSDDTSLRQRKSGTRRSKTTSTKRKLSLMSDHSYIVPSG